MLLLQFINFALFLTSSIIPKFTNSKASGERTLNSDMISFLAIVLTPQLPHICSILFVTSILGDILHLSPTSYFLYSLPTF